MAKKAGTLARREEERMKREKYVAKRYRREIDLAVEHLCDVIIIDVSTVGVNSCRIRAVEDMRVYRWYRDLKIPNALALHNLIIESRRDAIKEVSKPKRKGR